MAKEFAVEDDESSIEPKVKLGGGDSLRGTNQ
jgi:hypothetical protein